MDICVRPAASRDFSTGDMQRLWAPPVSPSVTCAVLSPGTSCRTLPTKGPGAAAGSAHPQYHPPSLSTHSISAKRTCSLPAHAVALSWARTLQKTTSPGRECNTALATHAVALPPMPAGSNSMTATAVGSCMQGVQTMAAVTIMVPGRYAGAATAAMGTRASTAAAAPAAAAAYMSASWCRAAQGVLLLLGVVCLRSWSC